MIQDIYPRKIFNQFAVKDPDPESIIFQFRGKDELLMRISEGKLYLPGKKDLQGDDISLQYLFSIDEQAFFLSESEDLSIKGFSYISIRKLRGMSEEYKYLVFAVYTAFQLANWYRDNHYCGRCGCRTVKSAEERCLDCPACGRKIYPRVVPAVIVGITDGDRLLITRYSDRPGSFYALIAGFTEIGETLEETVHREVREEVGLEVKNIRYYKSQPWGIADDILVGFFCDVDGDTSVCLDKNELSEALWADRKDIPAQLDDYSLTNEMMMAFKLSGRDVFSGKR